MRTLQGEVFDSRRPYAPMIGHHNKMGNRCTSKKLKPGQGGINCPCCTLWHPSKLKVKIRRYERRKAKQFLNEMHSLS